MIQCRGGCVYGGHRIVLSEGKCFDFQTCGSWVATSQLGIQATQATHTGQLPLIMHEYSSILFLWYTWQFFVDYVLGKVYWSSQWKVIQLNVSISWNQGYSPGSMWMCLKNALDLLHWMMNMWKMRKTNLLLLKGWRSSWRNIRLHQSFSSV